MDAAQMQHIKRPTQWVDMDMALCDLEYAFDLLDAVRIAIGTGDLPSEAAANAVFGTELLFQRTCKELRTDWDAMTIESPKGGNADAAR